MNISTKSLTISTILTFLLIIAFTIWGELSQPFKTLLQSATGHHWVTKSLAAVVVFILSYFIFSRAAKEEKNLAVELYILGFTALLGALAIFFFYVWHFLS